LREARSATRARANQSEFRFEEPDLAIEEAEEVDACDLVTRSAGFEGLMGLRQQSGHEKFDFRVGLYELAVGGFDLIAEHRE
jgi:hypothetical protein